MKINWGTRVLASGLIPVLGLLCAACGPKQVKTTASGSLNDFVAEAKTRPAAEPSAEGSLWVAGGRRSSLFRDFKASEVNDVVTILVLESTLANASADAKSSKDTEADIGFTNLFGAEKHIKEVANAVSGKSSSSFKGEGSTTRATTLRTTLTARVREVLPNGYLVVEGVREVRLNNENQTVILTGVVRPEDISYRNTVTSSAVAQMQVSVQGRGVVSQPLKPGWLYRILNGIMPF